MRLIGLAVVLALSLTVASLEAEVQPPGKIYRIGYLGTNLPPAHQEVVERRQSRPSLRSDERSRSAE
jgi:hypothetical protein